MARPLRLSFPGAVHHVTARGDRREPIYRDDKDRVLHLDVLALALERFDAELLSYCLMGNHYHLVLHTRQANLSGVMRHINGVYTQRFNRRHELSGHLFQGRFKAILVDHDAYLLALCRYVERNPVAAGLVRAAVDWPWSSARAHLGLVASPRWLDSDRLHGHMLGSPIKTPASRRLAILRYEEHLRQDDDADLWKRALRQQVFLGDESFVQRQLAMAPDTVSSAREVPRQQRIKPVTLATLLAQGLSRELALHVAYTKCGQTMTQLAGELGLSVSRVSRLIAGIEAADQQTAGKRQDLTPNGKSPLRK